MFRLYWRKRYYYLKYSNPEKTLSRFHIRITKIFGFLTQIKIKLKYFSHVKPIQIKIVFKSKTLKPKMFNLFRSIGSIWVTYSSRDKNISRKNGRISENTRSFSRSSLLNLYFSTKIKRFFLHYFPEKNNLKKSCIIFRKMCFFFFFTKIFHNTISQENLSVFLFTTKILFFVKYWTLLYSRFNSIVYAHNIIIIFHFLVPIMFLSTFSSPCTKRLYRCNTTAYLCPK